jgi:hypothetical protein
MKSSEWIRLLLGKQLILWHPPSFNSFLILEKPLYIIDFLGQKSTSHKSSFSWHWRILPNSTRKKTHWWCFRETYQRIICQSKSRTKCIAVAEINLQISPQVEQVLEKFARIFFKRI